MNLFIIDDDEAVRSMLIDIIEDYDLGSVVGEASNGSLIDENLLAVKKVDILIIDLLMPVRDGLQTIRDLGSSFTGKIIMISQVEDKDMVGKAYLLGIEYYITKPINRLEVISVIKKVIENIRLQKSVQDIEKALNILEYKPVNYDTKDKFTDENIVTYSQYLLTELGMIGESGSKDLINMVEYLFQYQNENPFENEFPSMKNILSTVAIRKLGENASDNELKKEIKASEQRVRRAIFQGLNHFSSLGLTDYSNPKFEQYATKFFDFIEIRKLMMDMQNNIKPSISHVHINIKKFVRVLYLESKKEYTN
ncbi:response regulator [Clostridium fermenticellae]|uniref:Stage 0 sporulation protein A homolog n=1 Tax=Clostridium fermenticellae TaxID=2068654 RepID=A0A386H124_9CLOT|nr:response regulator [Clostridium fermenticellae]AYD39364.1 response regulator [Clostridium fermenticellae]